MSDDHDDEMPPTPRVSTLPPPVVTRPSPEALADDRRPKTWTPDVEAPTRFSPPAPVPLDVGWVPPPSSGPRVLVVEDDHSLRESICSTLEEDGYHVAEASNGWDGLLRFGQMARESRIDVLMLDLHMPRMSGIEVMTVLQAFGFDVPIVVISGDKPPRNAEHDSGFLYLRKPIDRDKLLATIRLQIEEGRERRGLRR